MKFAHKSYQDQLRTWADMDWSTKIDTMAELEADETVDDLIFRLFESLFTAESRLRDARFDSGLCLDCGGPVITKQQFLDDPLSTCPSCS